MWAGGAAITFVVRLRGGGVVTTRATPMAERVCNALVSTWRYVAATVWPAGLAPFYPPVHRADVAGGPPPPGRPAGAARPGVRPRPAPPPAGRRALGPGLAGARHRPLPGGRPSPP